MNSLNLLSARVGIGGRPRPQRSRSMGDAIRFSSESHAQLPPLKRSISQHAPAKIEDEDEKEIQPTLEPSGEVSKLEIDEVTDEKQPLLGDERLDEAVNEDSKPSHPRSLLFRIVTALSGSLRWLLSRLMTPASFRRSRRRKTKINARASTARALGWSSSTTPPSEKSSITSGADQHGTSIGSESQDADIRSGQENHAQTSSDDSVAPRRSIRIKLANDDPARKRKSRRTKVSAAREELAAAELKSPTSPSSSLGLTKYPHAPRPPRPLIPRRQPLYNTYNPSQSSSLSQKTLVLDLDETLIHSLAKGGRMSSGHMVEVRLAAPTAYNGTAIGPQHPILYYVHKRPHCDEFLRRVSQWYNLVAFTASVQEYADPVIDWLEQERKYFSARYYRQHCTFRNGAYIKDLSSIEPDLSRVMILDNSPLSYIFHESNAIPIEGWINDPTDNDLLHLIPLFEGLQYVTDVRALLALRRGEIEATQ